MEPNLYLKISGVKLVTSYSWQDEETPTIAIPARLPRWLGRFHEHDLRQLPSSASQDVNAAKFPRSPWEPGIRALLDVYPCFPFQHMSLIADCETLHSILGFNLGKKWPFRFGVQIIGRTVVLIGLQNESVDPMQDPRGCRMFSMDENPGANEEPDFLAHYRIITYRLGELQVLLRHKVDACMERFVVSELVDGRPDKPAPLVRMNHDGFTVNIARVPNPYFHYIGFDFVPRVLEAPMTRKMRSEHINELLPSVWLAQTHFQATIGYVASSHERQRPNAAHGSVTIPPNEIMLFEAEKGVSLWALEQHAAIRAFHGSLQELLAELQAYKMKGHGDVFLVERGEGSDEFDITASENLPSLSADLCERVKNNGWYEWPFPGGPQQSH